MKKILSMVFALIFLHATAAGQDATGGIHGTITGPQGATVPYLWIRAVDKDGVEFDRDESSPDGTYRLSGLPPGTYTLESNPPCCAFLWYVSEEIVVADSPVEFAVDLEEGSSFNTVGDDPGVIAAAIRGEADIPDEPMGRMADGKPDLSGIWLIGFDPFPEEAHTQDWAQALLDERIDNEFAEHPHTQCLPGDPPIAGGAAPFIAKFVQTPELLVVLMEDYPGFRQVFMDGRSHPEYPNPSWMGHSIGRWEGDTLVVDTIGYNDRGWLEGYPRSEQLHIVERYTRTELGFMDVHMTVEDPGVFNAPWERRMRMHLAPHAELIEYVCENNKWGGPSSD